MRTIVFATLALVALAGEPPLASLIEGRCSSLHAGISLRAATANAMPGQTKPPSAVHDLRVGRLPPPLHAFVCAGRTLASSSAVSRHAGKHAEMRAARFASSNDPAEVVQDEQSNWFDGDESDELSEGDKAFIQTLRAIA